MREVTLTRYCGTCCALKFEIPWCGSEVSSLVLNHTGIRERALIKKEPSSEMRMPLLELANAPPSRHPTSSDDVRRPRGARVR